MRRFVRCLSVAAAAAAAAAATTGGASSAGELSVVAASSVLSSSSSPSSPRRRTQAASPSPGILDASDNRLPSTESSFDHMLDLSPEGTVRLAFHWNDPAGSMFTGRLIHRAPSASSDTGWLGFGIYDIHSRGNLGRMPDSAANVMIGSQAIIGNVATGRVSKYNLGAKNLGPGGVEKMGETLQTLVPTATSIIQHEGDDGHVTTILSFEKMLREANDEEIDVSSTEHNLFLFAVGPPASAEGTDDPDTALGFHVLKGAFKLNFADVEAKAKGGGGGGGGSGAYDGGASGGGGTVTDISPADAPPTQDNGGGGGSAAANDYSDANAAIIAADALNKCKSDDPDYLHMVHLAPDLRLDYDLDVWSDTDPATIAVKITYDGTAWLGFGVSPDGNMIGTEAVIGRPDLARADGERPLKYRLKGKGTTAVVPMDVSEQTLIDAEIVQQNGKTIMTFKKLLIERGQQTIEPTGEMIFVWAVGNSDALSFHGKKGSVRIDLSKCESPDAYDGSTTTANSEGQPYRANRSGWIAHGVLATLAWATLAPFAVTTAWFRTLVPSSWIYVHVFANVGTFLFTLIAFIVAVVTMSSEPASSHFSDVHHVLGLAMLMLTTFQVMNGFLRPPVEKRDPYSMEGEQSAIAAFLNFPDTARGVWKLAHRVSGVCLLAGGFYQIARGCDLYARGVHGSEDQSWKPYFYFYLISFGLVMVGLRLWMWWEERRARMNVDLMNPDQRQMGSLAVASGVDPNSELVPVQFDVRIQ